MLNLIRKDFIVMRSSLGLIPLYFVIFSIVLISNTMSAYFLVAVYTAFTTLMMSTGADVKNDNHAFLITMPMNRAQMVKSKYATALLYTGVAAIACYIFYTIVRYVKPSLGMPAYSMGQFLASIGISLVLVSIYLPLFYWLSKKGMAIINMAFMIILIGLTPFMNIGTYLMHKQNVGSINNASVALIGLGVVLLFIASYFFAKYLFNRKDL
ncbi:ABC-2 transporter permease [Paenibacillus terrigena]|uniref:ABC-2 transporter permease n=1 Tax=Paenibacillus terrigena TaxID=369333 RepID=UPI00036BF56B|nr:ABC-2 transporter permease [Paenibacillus terrigena]